MHYQNKYEFLNQESRLHLLKVLKKYNISEEDMEQIENILWWTYNQYDDVSTIANFYEKKFGHTAELFHEYLAYYDQTHQQPVDYRKLSQKSVYDDDYDEGEWE